MIAAIDELVQPHVAVGGPGMAVGVVKDGVVIHRRGYGLAHLEWECPIAPDTVFNLASLTKPFTAQAIMLLAEDGKLHIDDPAVIYLPEYLAEAPAITVRHLLTHTSGIPNYVTLPEVWPIYARQPLAPAEIVALVRDLPLDFAPGDRYCYSNTGYCLLGMLIEKLADMPYGAFLRERLFAPLGMAQSGDVRNEAIIPRRAAGYERDDTGWQHIPLFDMHTTFASGSLGSTLDDLIRWDAALRAGQIIGPALHAQMTEPLRLNDGRREGYGLGWALSAYRGQHVAHHAGGVPGFSTFFGRFAEADCTIIILSNIALFKAAALVRQIADLLLALPPPAHQPATLDAAMCRAVAGTYADSVYARFVISEEGERLFLQGANLAGELLPIAADAPDEVAFALAGDPDITVRYGGRGDAGWRWLTVTRPLFWTTAYRVEQGELIMIG
jgi:CubicO group peptidase (beta-lactamase class C family)